LCGGGVHARCGHDVDKLSGIRGRFIPQTGRMRQDEPYLRKMRSLSKWTRGSWRDVRVAGARVPAPAVEIGLMMNPDQPAHHAKIRPVCIVFPSPGREIRLAPKSRIAPFAIHR
jgi:hypothetical protein